MILEATLFRRFVGPNSTLGWLEVPGSGWWVLERKLAGSTAPHDPSQPSESAMPAGRWEIRWTWSHKFERSTLELEGIPGHDGVRIHSGNVWQNTEGCLLVGKAYVAQGKDYVLVSSQKARDEVELVFKNVLAAGHQAYLTILDPVLRAASA